MATNINNGSGVKSLLQEEVTCPVCQDVYCAPEKVPKKLVCDHIFCLRCLQKLILRSIDGKLTCPVCRDTKPLQESDANQYPTAHQVNRLIDIYHKTLQEQAQKSPVEIKPPEPRTCHLHSSQPLALYCETCQKTVCRDCALFLCAPKKHEYGFLKEVAEKYKAELDDKMEHFRDLQKKVTTTSVAIKEHTMILEKQKREELRKIEAVIEMLFLSITEQKKQMISEAQKPYEIQLVRYASNVKEYEEAFTSLATAIQTTEDLNIVQSLATMESFRSKQKQNLQALQCQIEELLCQPQLSSEPNMKIEYIRQQFDLKKFLLYVGNGFKCCVSEYNQLKNLRLKWPFQINFQLAGLKNEAKIKSKLICMHDRSSVSLAVTKAPPNSIRLSGTPQNRGKHELHVLIGDSHICGSPIPAFVFFESHQLPIRKTKPITFDNADAIKCYNNNVMVSSRSTLNIMEHKNNSLTVIKKIECPGIAEFAVHSNFVYYSDIHRNRVVKVDMNGRVLAYTGGKGSHPGEFEYPNGVRIHNDQIFVCDTCNGRIQVFNISLDLQHTIGVKGDAPGQLAKPYDLVFDGDGNMYVVENRNRRIQVLSPQGDHIRFICSSEIKDPVSPAIYNGHLFITDINRNRILVFTLGGTFVTSFAGEYRMECIDIDENGFIYVTNNRQTISIY